MEDKKKLTNEVYAATTLSSVNLLEKVKIRDNIFVGSTIKMQDVQSNIVRSESVTKSRLTISKNYSNGKDFEQLGKKRSNTKKFKEPGVLKEYPASRIPNNIGNKSIDKLTDYVNGRNEKRSCKFIKSEKKMKHLVANKKNENDKKQNENLLKLKDSVDDSKIMVLNQSKEYSDSLKNVIGSRISCDSEIRSPNIDEDSLNEFTKGKYSNSINPDNISGNDYDDEDFYQVVRRKTRNKTKIVRQANSSTEIKRFTPHVVNKNDAQSNRNFADTVSKENGNESISKNFKVININDKKILNWFIYQLWIEFQNKHDKYMKEQMVKQ